MARSPRVEIITVDPILSTFRADDLQDGELPFALFVVVATASTVPRWDIHADVRYVNGRFFLCELRMKPTRGDASWPDDAITESLLRRVPVRAIVAATADAIVAGRAIVPNKMVEIQAFWDQHLSYVRRAIGRSAHGRGLGRPVWRNDEYLAEVAEATLIAQETGVRDGRQMTADILMLR